MDITRSNFEAKLKQISDEIKDCDFLSIDGEFTGLNAGLDTNQCFTPLKHYELIYQFSRKFLLMQLGVCIFKYNKEYKRYNVAAYRMYIFPRPIEDDNSDSTYLLQTSSINFLADHGFDFNKLFREGISFLNGTDEQSLRDHLMKTRDSEESGFSSEEKDKISTMLNGAVGMTNLMRVMADSEKLIIGHNMFLDLFHILNQFFIPVPQTLQEFKRLCHFLFPKVIDTKVMASSDLLNKYISNTSLSKLHQNLKKKPFYEPHIFIREDCSDVTRSESRFHDGCYDALITGLSFITMSQFLCDLNSNDVVPLDSDCLKLLMNKLILKNLSSIPFIDLAESDSGYSGGDQVKPLKAQLKSTQAKRDSEDPVVSHGPTKLFKFREKGDVSSSCFKSTSCSGSGSQKLFEESPDW